MAFDTREQWLNEFMERARPHFAAAGHPIPYNTRVSIGFPSTGYKGKAVGECWSSDASEDGHFEIFLNPTSQNEARIADILTHELCHAALGIAAGHGPAFRALATSLGLTGKMTATIAGSGWYAWALPILAELGPLPYAAIKGRMKPPRKTAKTYLLKTYCPVCGWTARVTKAHVVNHSHLDCPAPTCNGELLVDWPEEEEDVG